MSENTDGGSAETTDTSASGEVDAQLAEMHTAEAPEPEKPEEPAEAAPEVKKVVPLAALHEERRARQELQRQLAERDRRHEESMARINQRLEAMTAPRQQVPNREEDAVGYLDHKIGQLAQGQEQILSQQQQREQEAHKQKVLAQLTNAVLVSRDEFAKTTPDLGDAQEHLHAARARELMALGMPEMTAKQRAVKELDNALLGWAHEGRNPAEVAYQFALARGYQPKAQQTPADKIAAQQKGAAAARTLGGGGAVSGGKLTAEALANMSDEDFAKLTDSDFRKAMGG